jgi:plastocyanin
MRSEKLEIVSNPLPDRRRTRHVMPTKTRSQAARLTGTIGAVFLIAGLASACGSSGSPAATPSATLNSATTVSTKLLSFVPEKLTVKAGTTVTWTDTDDIAHTVTTGTFVLGSDGLRTSENPDGRINMPLSMGHDLTYTFTKPGKYIYYCSIHKGMNGEIDVTP